MYDVFRGGFGCALLVGTVVLVIGPSLKLG